MSEKKVKDLFGLALYVILVIFVVFILHAYVLQQYRVSGPSMETTLYDGDILLLDKISPNVGNINRGDIVVFKYLYDNDTYYVKRVIGLPGEGVRIKDGKIYVNNELLENQYSFTPINDPGIAAKNVRLKSNEYFVLGDNRGNSVDSRDADVGAVKQQNIVGRVIFRMGPVSRMGLVD